MILQSMFNCEYTTATEYFVMANADSVLSS